MVALGLLLATSAAVAAGHFEGRLVLDAMDDGTLETEQAFAYIDMQGVRWEVPVRSKTDGASVPKVLWGLLPPLQGRYLKAAVVHDVNCDSRTQPWQRVHQIFYEAMIDAQVDEITAKIMYAAVYAFGPRWNADGSLQADELPRPEVEQTIALDGLKLWIEENRPSLDAIRQRVDGDGL